MRDGLEHRRPQRIGFAERVSPGRRFLQTTGFHGQPQLACHGPQKAMVISGEFRVSQNQHMISLRVKGQGCAASGAGGNVMTR